VRKSVEKIVVKHAEKRVEKKRLGRRPSGEIRHNLHVEVNAALFERVQKRAGALGLNKRKVVEKGLELFLQSTSKTKTAA
jgi:hypothetical protein